MSIRIDDDETVLHTPWADGIPPGLLEELSTFVADQVGPRAAAHDSEQRIAPELVRELADRGYLGSFLPTGHGGRALGYVAYSLLHEVIGAACTSTRSLITVHDMVTFTVWKRGAEAARDAWLTPLRTGRVLGAFALSEPHGGDPARIETVAQRDGPGYVLTGSKKWISFAQIADLFLVFARTGAGTGAFLLPRSTPGLEIEPIEGLVGARGSMLGRLNLSGCRVARENLIGRWGRAWPQIVTEALTLGRIGVAAGSVGLAQASFEAAREHARQRRVGTEALLDQQLVQRLLCDMVTGIEAGRLLCRNAAWQLGAADPAAPMSAMIAKYFTATTAARATRDAVQVLGAAGCVAGNAVERFFRDAKTMEIIEGGNEIQQTVIGRFANTRPL